MIPLPEVDELRLTIVTDNTIDFTLPDAPVARRLQAPAEMRLDLQPPVAEHGFSVLLDVRRGAGSARVLFDTGISQQGFLHNLDALEIRVPDIQAVVLSHGHSDHTTGLLGLADRFGERRLPMIVHPDAYLERKIVFPNGREWKMPAPLLADFRKDGLEVIQEVGPSMLVEDMVLVSGEIGRTTDFEHGLPPQWARRNGHWEPDPLTHDDQCAIVRVKDKGLVVISGCGHAGIVNTVRYAQALTGEQRVYAIIGGFHLNGSLFEPIIPRTVQALVEINPRYVVPGHCTGFPAAMQIALALPDAYLTNSVGTTYVL
jgi:7,8-dihydropterin-6-yl-methyl-4-(beta-D-ribofuranosyl)aminobenzene 5'-phosphate synthase